MRRHFLIINYKDLLCLTLIPHEAKVVNAPIDLLRARLLVHPPCNQSDLHTFTVNNRGFLAKVSLHKGRKPLRVDFISDEIRIECQVPKVILVTRDEFHGIFRVLLPPFKSSLAWASHIVPIAEVESILQQLLSRIQQLYNLGVNRLSLKQIK